jgi:hypothetical protein
MEYVLTGFQQDNNIRRYAFQGIAGDRTRVDFTVNVDLSLIRRYEISVQELPLLCRHLLEGQLPEQDHTVTFTEDDMRGHASTRAAAQLAADQKKVHRRPPSGRVGEAWRSPKPVEPAG